MKRLMIALALAAATAAASAQVTLLVTADADGLNTRTLNAAAAKILAEALAKSLAQPVVVRSASQRVTLETLRLARASDAVLMLGDGDWLVAAASQARKTLPKVLDEFVQVGTVGEWPIALVQPAGIQGVDFQTLRARANGVPFMPQVRITSVGEDNTTELCAARLVSFMGTSFKRVTATPDNLQRDLINEDTPLACVPLSAVRQLSKTVPVALTRKSEAPAFASLPVALEKSLDVAVTNPLVLLAPAEASESTLRVLRLALKVAMEREEVRNALINEAWINPPSR